MQLITRCAVFLLVFFFFWGGGGQLLLIYLERIQTL